MSLFVYRYSLFHLDIIFRLSLFVFVDIRYFVRLFVSYRDSFKWRHSFIIVCIAIRISLLIYHYSLFVIRYRYSVFIRDIVIRLHAYSLLYSFTHLYCVSFKYHYSFFIFVYKHYLVLMLVYSYSTSRGWRILVQLEGARWRLFVYSFVLRFI